MISNTIISNIEVDNYKCFIPVKGYKKNIIDFSINNLLLNRNVLKKSTLQCFLTSQNR